MRAIRTERYKYIRNFGLTKYLLPNLDTSEIRSFLVGNGFLDSEKPQEMLFDLYLDPVERVNLAQGEQYSEVKVALEKELIEMDACHPRPFGRRRCAASQVKLA